MHSGIADMCVITGPVCQCQVVIRQCLFVSCQVSCSFQPAGRIHWMAYGNHRNRAQKPVAPEHAAPAVSGLLGSVIDVVLA